MFCWELYSYKVSTQSFLDTGFAHYKDFEEQVFHKLKGERCLAIFALVQLPSPAKNAAILMSSTYLLS